MKILKNINFVGAFIAGALFIVFLFHAYTVYQIRAVTAQNEATLNQVVAWIKAVEAQSQTQTQPVSQPVPTTKK